MEESDTPDAFNIAFPNKIGKREARNLLRHLVFAMPGKCTLDLRTEIGEHFGERSRDRDYRSREEVPVISSDVSMKGVIRDSEVTSAEFYFSKIYNEEDEVFYNALRLAFGAYDWDEISQEGRQLVANIRSSVQSYFE